MAFFHNSQGERGMEPKAGLHGLVWRVCVLAACVLFVAAGTAAAVGTPHVVFGQLATGADIPADSDITFRASIAARPGEVLIQTSPGCGYESNILFVEVGNFPTQWVEGDILDVTVFDQGRQVGAMSTQLAGDNQGFDTNTVSIGRPAFTTGSSGCFVNSAAPKAGHMANVAAFLAVSILLIMGLLAVARKSI
jgi:hypothetical protein